MSAIAQLQTPGSAASATVLHESEQRFHTIFEAAAIGMAHCMLDGLIVESNPALERVLGYGHEELRGRRLGDFTHAEDRVGDQSLFRELMAGQRDSYQIEKRFLRKDGACVWGRLTYSLVRGPGEKPEFTIGMVEDITERKRTEQQLREAQKMEVVGRLVGGVAHDFNNLLTGIMLYCDLLRAGLENGSRLRHHAEEIRMASQHGAALIRQLLAIARQQAVEPRVVSINQTVLGMRDLLARLIGEDIELVLRLDRHLGSVKMDPAQVHQIVLNLVLNARDAMPQGGVVTLETRNCDRRLPSGHPESPPVPCVLLAVSDNGSGMDSAIRAHLFEPFFTTKKPGQGNGLGLTTVHSIVKRYAGAIDVDSEHGRGTRISVLLPRTQEDTGFPSRRRTAPSPKGRETVLLVEDNTAVRTAARRILSHCGYKVLEAANGPDALSMVRAHKGSIDLLLADLVMPGISGRELACQLRTLRPQLKVLYTSGYHLSPSSGTPGEPVVLFRKPFTSNTLARMVSKVLEGSSGRRPEKKR